FVQRFLKFISKIALLRKNDSPLLDKDYCLEKQPAFSDRLQKVGLLRDTTLPIDVNPTNERF
ncbi:hypothetical protein, partial [Faucicola atlantae]|uniref:hypothetical protein n=1 Tax=Faucicola atlantae TaxID=34059 RepID=UPI001C12A824